MVLRLQRMHYRIGVGEVPNIASNKLQVQYNLMSMQKDQQSCVGDDSQVLESCTLFWVATMSPMEKVFIDW